MQAEHAHCHIEMTHLHAVARAWATRSLVPRAPIAVPLPPTTQAMEGSSAPPLSRVLRDGARSNSCRNSLNPERAPWI